MLNGLPRILIVRLSAIGDVVRVLPALHTLRVAHPNAQIDWVVEPKAAEILEGHSELDQVLIFERESGFRASTAAYWHLCQKIRASRYDITIDFHGILKSGFLTWWSRAPERLGFGRPRAQEGSFLAYTKRPNLGGEVLNRVEENLRLAELLAPRQPISHIPLAVPDDIQEEIETYFHDSFDGGKSVVAVHVPVDRPEKAWPLEYFAALSDLLRGDGRFEVVLTWGPGQLDQVEEVVRRARRSVHVAPAMESLKHYIWFIHCADLYFGGDTGPMHIAAAMGTPVVAVFGGTNPIQHAPLGLPAEILTAEGMAENGGRAKGLRGANKLRLITPEAAYDACVRMLHRQRQVSGPPLDDPKFTGGDS